MFKDKQTLFEYVYQSISDQILTGYLSYGEKLPSMSQLSELYHVGIRTIKDVMLALKKEGLITTEERKAATVIYNHPQISKNSSFKSILECKSSIIEIYETISIIMPLIFSFSASTMEYNEWKEKILTLNRSINKKPEEHMKCYTSFLYNLLESSNNLLFRDLFTNLEIYGKMLFFRKNDEFISFFVTHNDFNSFNCIINHILTKNDKEIYDYFRLLYKYTNHTIKELLNMFSLEFTDISETESSAFSWNIQRGRDHFYIQIVHDIVDKIGIGIYKEGTFLPHEKELAEHYNVCVSTIRNSLAMLNEVGFAKTFNAKGTKVIWQDDKSIIKCLKNKELKRDTLMYLSGLQLMAMIIKPASTLAFIHITEKEKYELREQFKDPNVVPIERIVQCVIDHQTLQPMKIILQEINGLTIWGYYFSYYSNGHLGDKLLIQKSMSAFENLCHGDVEKFGDTLSECYCHILSFIKDFLVSCGLLDANKIVTPNNKIFK